MNTDKTSNAAQCAWRGMVALPQRVEFPALAKSRLSLRERSVTLGESV